MILTWFHRWKRGTKAQALVSAYRDLPPEHRETATYSTVDEDGVYRVQVMTVDRAIRWSTAEWERAEGQPAVSPELD